MKNMKDDYTSIPEHVSNWTDKYFHQSSFDMPWNFPSQRVLKFLSNFKKNKNIKLFRGISEFNQESLEIFSWTYSIKVAKGYAGKNGKIISKVFSPEEIILDTTLLTNQQKTQIGYDYGVDDREVLVLNN